MRIGVAGKNVTLSIEYSVNGTVKAWPIHRMTPRRARLYAARLQAAADSAELVAT